MRGVTTPCHALKTGVNDARDARRAVVLRLLVLANLLLCHTILVWMWNGQRCISDLDRPGKMLNVYRVVQRERPQVEPFSPQSWKFWHGNALQLTDDA